MSYQVLARKWRPRTFAEMVGQEHVLRALINALDNDRLHHAFLFTGTRGVGKTTVARILAKSLNCEKGVGSTPCGECSNCREIDEGRFVDLLEVDAASRTKVEDTRELLDNVQYAPTRGRFKVYLIDEVHMLSGHSFNALLKTLEEPPPHVKFLLATTDPQKLPITILSRCLQFNLKRLPVEQIRDHLVRILAQEGIEAEAPALAEIARAADGSMRDALSLLDQAIAYGNGALAQAEVREMLGTVDRDRVFALLGALAAGDAQGLLEQVQRLADFAPDYAGILAEITAVLHRVALAQAVPAAVEDGLGDQEALLALAAELTPEDVQLYYQIGIIGRRDLPLAPEPRSGLEMVLLRMLAFRPGGAEAVAGGGRTRPGERQVSAASTPRPASASPSATTAQVTAPPPPVEPAAVAEPPVQAAPAVTEAPSTPSAPVPSGEGAWATIVAALDIGGVTQQLALHSSLQQQGEGRIVLALEPAFVHLLSEQRQQTLREALEKYLGTSLKLEIRLEESGAATPAQLRQEAAQARLQEAQTEIENDPGVQSLLERFDGRIEPGSVRPVE